MAVPTFRAFVADAIVHAIGLLVGIAGIGVSLIAATSALEPNWDRIFLLDIPPLPAS